MRKMYIDNEIANIAKSNSSLYRHYITVTTTNYDLINFIVYKNTETAFTKDDLFDHMDNVLPSTGGICMMQAVGAAKVPAIFSTIGFTGQITVYGTRPMSQTTGTVNMYFFNNTVSKATTSTVSDVVKKV